MTTTVKRGAGRPAAAARTAKAAQRIELPATEQETPLSEQTAAQLRETARKLGLSPSAKTPKDKLIGLIYAKTTPATPTPEAATGEAPATAPKTAGNTEKRPESHPERRAGSGPAKLARLREALEPFGWKVTAKTTGDRIEATAKRGKDTLRQVWVGGAYDYGASSYNGRKVRNLSEAIRLGAREVDPGK